MSEFENKQIDFQVEQLCKRFGVINVLHAIARYLKKRANQAMDKQEEIYFHDSAVLVANCGNAMIGMSDADRKANQQATA